MRRGALDPGPALVHVLGEEGYEMTWLLRRFASVKFLPSRRPPSQRPQFRQPLSRRNPILSHCKNLSQVQHVKDFLAKKTAPPPQNVYTYPGTAEGSPSNTGFSRDSAGYVSIFLSQSHERNERLFFDVDRFFIASFFK